MKAKRIVLIGSGNVASSLGRALKKSGNSIVQVYSRNDKKAGELAKQLKCWFTDDLRAIEQDADVYIISVSDDAVKNIAKSLPRLKGLVVHTSGTCSMGLLRKQSRFGVIYPLQTIQKNRSTKWKDVRFLIEGNDATSIRTIRALVFPLSKTLIHCSSENRKKVHLAAVMACNFTNHLIALSQQRLKQIKLPATLINSLIEETFTNALNGDAGKLQTGPAKRNDQQVIREHLKMLNASPQEKAVYKALTQSILNTYPNKK